MTRPHPEFLEKFRSEDNVWNRYETFRTEKTTTDKLHLVLDEAYAVAPMIWEGDAPGADAWEIVQVTFTGGRDWVVILGNVGP